MATIPNAKQSPRIINGVLYWYVNDTFDLNIELELQDQDGEAITASGTVDVVFRDCCQKVVKEFTQTPVNNIVTLSFDAETTKLFGIGDYIYDAFYNGENRTTIINENKAVVE